MIHLHWFMNLSNQHICRQNKPYKNNISIKSRIALQMNKPKMFNRTPDLLYAIKAYLSCDTGANTIQITGVSDGYE